MLISNAIFYLTNFRKIRKKEKQEKEEFAKAEKQARRVLESNVFKNSDQIDW